MKQKFLKMTGVIILLVIALSSCEKNDPDPGSSGPMVSPGKQVIYFKTVNPNATGTIDTINKKINVSVPTGTVLTSIATDISVAPGHTISPASGAPQNFTSPVIYTVTRPDKSTTAWTVTVAVADVLINQNITQSVTWTADKTYIINKEIIINNSSVLTIEPGTVIRFGAGGSLAIGYSSNATIIANGTAQNPITFTSSALIPAPGAWEGLYFYDKTLNNSSLTYCNIQYAGSITYDGALNLLGCDITMNNCTISNSGANGIVSEFNSTTGKGGFVAFSNNILSNITNNAIIINAQKLSSIDGTNTFTNTKGILIEGHFRSATAQTWKKLTVPYIVNSELDIDGTLTIEPGTTFNFGAAGAIEVGYYQTSNFTADGGSIATPITFTSSAASPAAGSWKGIVIHPNTQTGSKMNYCIIEYAGSSEYEGALQMNGAASFNFTNNKIRNSGSYGITLESNAGFKSFSGNSIESCENHLIDIGIKHLPELGANNVLTAAPGKGIRVTGDVQYATLVTWKKQTADFYIDGGGSLDVDGDLTIEAGCKFNFVNGSYFWFGYFANTRITAKGTSTNKITFTSASLSPAPGTWKGLYFDSKVQTNSELSYCDFKYSGMDGEPAIYTEVSFPVSNTSITDYSTTNAAEYKTGLTKPAGTGNNFTWVAN